MLGLLATIGTGLAYSYGESAIKAAIQGIGAPIANAGGRALYDWWYNTPKQEVGFFSKIYNNVTNFFGREHAGGQGYKFVIENPDLILATGKLAYNGINNYFNPEKTEKEEQTPVERVLGSAPSSKGLLTLFNKTKELALETKAGEVITQNDQKVMREARLKKLACPANKI